MSCNRRQIAAYKSLCDIWQVDTPVVNGKPGNAVYTKMTKDPVPCLYEYTPNVDDPTEAGRLKRFTLFTTDKIHFAADVVIKDGWMTVNKTLQADGTQSKSYGEVHRMLGDPRFIESRGRRDGNKQEIEAMTLEHPPPEVAG